MLGQHMYGHSAVARWEHVRQPGAVCPYWRVNISLLALNSTICGIHISMLYFREYSYIYYMHYNQFDSLRDFYMFSIVLNKIECYYKLKHIKHNCLEKKRGLHVFFVFFFS